MLPPPVRSTADLCDATRWPTRVPPGHELVFGPDPRPCVPPPPDDRLELLRAFILDGADGYKKHCAKVLIARAALDDREAWEAIARDLDGPGRGNTCDVAEALATGDLDKAVAAAALVCGDIDEDRQPLPEKWCREMRAQLARKGGAR